jgi:hypothetical protein
MDDLDQIKVKKKQPKKKRSRDGNWLYV